MRMREEEATHDTPPLCNHTYLHTQLMNKRKRTLLSRGVACCCSFFSHDSRLLCFWLTLTLGWWIPSFSSAWKVQRERERDRKEGKGETSTARPTARHNAHRSLFLSSLILFSPLLSSRRLVLYDTTPFHWLLCCSLLVCVLRVPPLSLSLSLSLAPIVLPFPLLSAGFLFLCT